MIYIGSRYQTTPVFYMLDGRTGRTRPTILRDNADVAPTSSRVTKWEDGMRLDIVASSIYNDPEKWWRVMDQNPDILDPMSFVAGTTLRVP